MKEVPTPEEAAQVMADYIAFVEASPWPVRPLLRWRLRRQVRELARLRVEIIAALRARGVIANEEDVRS